MKFKPIGSNYGVISPKVVLEDYTGKNCGKRVVLAFTSRAFEYCVENLKFPRKTKIVGLEAVKGLVNSREVCCLKIPPGAAISIYY